MSIKQKLLASLFSLGGVITILILFSYYSAHNLNKISFKVERINEHLVHNKFLIVKHNNFRIKLLESFLKKKALKVLNLQIKLVF